MDFEKKRSELLASGVLMMDPSAVWVEEDEIPRMVLYIEAAAKASLDVDTLSSVFQLDKAEVKYRIQFIDIHIRSAMSYLFNT